MFGLLNLLAMLAQTGIFSLINSDFNPLDQSAVSTFRSSEEAVKTAFKFVLPTVFASEVRWGEQALSEQLFLGLLAALYALWLLQHGLTPPKPVFSVGCQQSVQYVQLWWVTSCVCLQLAYDSGRVPDNLSLFYGAVGCGCLAFLAYLFERRRGFWFLTRASLELASEQAFVQVVYCLAVLTERAGERFYRRRLQGVLRSYSLVQKSRGAGESVLASRVLCAKSSLA